MRRRKIVLITLNGRDRAGIQNVFYATEYDVVPIHSDAELDDILLQPAPDLVIADEQFESECRYRSDNRNHLSLPLSPKASRRVKARWADVPILLVLNGWHRKDEVAAQPVDAVISALPERRELTALVERLLAIRPRALRVFLCHANEDSDKVRQIYDTIRADGFRPWFAQEDLTAGENWRLAITRQLRESDVVVVCLSQKSVGKRGFVQREVSFALDLLAEHPEGAVFVVPLLLEPCTIPDRLAHLHVVQMPLQEGLRRLRQVLFARANELGLPI